MRYLVRQKEGGGVSLTLETESEEDEAVLHDDIANAIAGPGDFVNRVFFAIQGLLDKPEVGEVNLKTSREVKAVFVQSGHDGYLEFDGSKWIPSQ